MKKVSKHTRKMESAVGMARVEARRSGLAKVLALLNKGTDGYVSKFPRAVDFTAAKFGL